MKSSSTATSLSSKHDLLEELGCSVFIEGASLESQKKLVSDMVQCCNTTLKQIIYSWCQIIVGQKLVSKVNSFVKQKYNPQLKCPKIMGNIHEYCLTATAVPFSPAKPSKLRTFPKAPRS